MIVVQWIPIFNPNDKYKFYKETCSSFDVIITKGLHE